MRLCRLRVGCRFNGGKLGCSILVGDDTRGLRSSNPEFSNTSVRGVPLGVNVAQMTRESPG